MDKADTPNQKSATDDTVGTAPQLKVSSSSKHIASETIVGGTYKVICVLGEGGMGTVYKVEQVFLQQQYAMKALHANLSDEFIRRFQREAQAASRLVHPNLVRAHYFGMTEDGAPYFIMDLVEGETVYQLLARVGTISLPQALEIFLPVCSALAAAHRQGVIHRDLKPSNIMLAMKPDSLGATVPMVVDFGIARIVEGATEEMTKTGEVFGTPLYMSPEQSLGRKVDQRSDIYSLACVMFHALTGAPPFCGESALATMMMHHNDAVPTLKEASMGAKFPPKLEAVFAKALAKDPGQRYQNCEEFAQDLESSTRIGQAEKVEQSSAAIEQLRARRRRTIAVSAGVLLLTSISLGFATVYFNRKNVENRSVDAALAPTTTTTAKTPEDTSAPKNSSTDVGQASWASLTEPTQTPSQNSSTDMAHSTWSRTEAAAFFSKVIGKERIFHFPPRINCGVFHWKSASSNDFQATSAEKEVRIPIGSKVLFELALLIDLP